jgi:twitching motility protein PilT
MRLNESVPQISLSELLRKLSELGGSDLHITTGSPPQVRVDGHLRPLEAYRVLTSADTKQLAYSVLTDAQKHRFEENLELDFSFGVKGLSRFRANLFNQSSAPFPTRSKPSKIWVCRWLSNSSAKNPAV